MNKSLFWLTKLSLKFFEVALKIRHFVLEPKHLHQTDFLRSMLLEASPTKELTAPLHASSSAITLKTLVIVPFRDRWELTQKCLETLYSQHSFIELAAQNLVKVILINNRSCETETIEGIKYWVAKSGFETMNFDEDFNFSKMNNLAVQKFADFEPDILFFLNNDITFEDKNDFLNLIQFSTPGIGAWGCTLKYPSDKIQHLFAAPGVKIVGAHPFRGVFLETTDPWFASAWPVPAVTGAAFLMKATVFNQTGGFDESLATAYQDVDLCLRLQELGLQQWSLGYVTLAHHETATRKPLHLPAEVDIMYDKWGSRLSWSSSLSSQISRWSEQPVRKWFEKDYPFRLYLRHCRRK